MHNVHLQHLRFRNVNAVTFTQKRRWGMKKTVCRTVELNACQDRILLAEGLFMIDRRERPLQNGWYDIEYDPSDQFIAVVGPKTELTEKDETDLVVVANVLISPFNGEKGTPLTH
jgi:hypothetical protein